MVYTLLLYSLSPYSQTDERTDGQRNKYTRFAWAGGTSHALCGLEEPEKKVLVVCLAGARSLLRPEKKRDRYYDRKKSSSRLSGGCAIDITTGKKSSSHVSGKCAIAITTGKKSSSRLSGGCAIVITTGKKEVLVVCLAGALSLLRPEKKVLVVYLAGAQSLLRPEKKVLVVCLADARLLLFLPRVRFTRNHPIFTRN